jgi:glucose/arabinose dehydrogenase
MKLAAVAPLALVFLGPAATAQHHVSTPALAPVPAAIAGKVKLELLTRDTTEAVGIVAVPDEAPGRLFVVEKRGLVRTLRGKTFDPRPFLDFTNRVSLEYRDNGERGLLGLVFHPRYTKNGRFYLNFTDKNGDTRVVEMRVDKKFPNRADLSSERQILFVDQPYANHNGGGLAFGPDGKLYVALGDGGSANDPMGNGQNGKTLLSKLMRIDVEVANAAPEVIGRGLRNPWRYTFDRKTGDLYIGDVGQFLFEYVHVVGANDLVGHNFGWSLMEGFHCFQSEACDVKGLTPPVVEYPHSEGCSITGGSVYRGKALPELTGVYFYADYCTALLRSFRWKNGHATESWDWKRALDPDSRLARLASFGEDQNGELYLVSHEGPIYGFARASENDQKSEASPAAEKATGATAR